MQQPAQDADEQRALEMLRNRSLDLFERIDRGGARERSLALGAGPTAGADPAR
ncbi:MAG TPA: hypothetical protein VKB73_13750 [Gaiellaceae bacterium]|nr:hypothetical protein [Gaiellaceae bacterium]